MEQLNFVINEGWFQSQLWNQFVRKTLNVIVRKYLLANLEVKDSTTIHLKIKLRVCLYFSLCIDVAKIYNVTEYS